MSLQPLKNSLAVVAGATRGTGRAIAIELGRAGATVYCAGRSTSGSLSWKNRPETIEETAELVTQSGGRGVAFKADFTKHDEVKNLFDAVSSNHSQPVSLFVNTIWGEFGMDWQHRSWEQDIAKAADL